MTREPDSMLVPVRGGEDEEPAMYEIVTEYTERGTYSYVHVVSWPAGEDRDDVAAYIEERLHERAMMTRADVREAYDAW